MGIIRNIWSYHEFPLHMEHIINIRSVHIQNVECMKQTKWRIYCAPAGPQGINGSAAPIGALSTSILTRLVPLWRTQASLAPVSPSRASGDSANGKRCRRRGLESSTICWNLACSWTSTGSNSNVSISCEDAFHLLRL